MRSSRWMKTTSGTGTGATRSVAGRRHEPCHRGLRRREMRPRIRTATGRIVMRLGNTPIGANVVVTPGDPRTGCSPVTIRFDEVLATGITSIESSGSGPAAPEGVPCPGRVLLAGHDGELRAKSWG